MSEICMVYSNIENIVVDVNKKQKIQIFNFVYFAQSVAQNPRSGHGII